MATPDGDAGAPRDEWVREAQRGSLAAFNELVLYYQRRVYNVCLRTLSNADDAADATQEAFLHAYRGVAEFQGSAGGFQSWLLRIAVNSCYDHLRRQKRRPTTSLEATEEAQQADARLAMTPVDPAPGPEQRALTAETARQLQAALSALSPEHRLSVVLCDVQGFSYEQAAEILGVELGTVKSRLSRARATLRDHLAARGELPARAGRL